MTRLCGLAIGYEGCQFLWSFRPPQYAQNLIDPKLDANVFLFALLVSLVTGFVFGVVPASRASKADVVEALKEETRTAGRGRRSMTLYVRSKGDPAGVLMSVQREMRNIDPKIEVSDIRTGAKIIDQVLFGARIGVGLLGVFGVLALVLASVGLYGIMAYSVNRREREIGLRMALGAEQSSALRLILGQGMALVGIGIAIGLAASFIVGRALTRMLYGISSADPLSLVGASVVLIVVAMLACYLPAHSASRVDPMMALREGRKRAELDPKYKYGRKHYICFIRNGACRY